MQSGGSISLSSYLYLASGGSSNGAYTLGGSSLLAAATEYIGYSGSGSFTQTGGTHAVSSVLYLGYKLHSIGTYNLSGGGLLSATMRIFGLFGHGNLHAIRRHECDDKPYFFRVGRQL